MARKSADVQKDVEDCEEKVREVGQQLTDATAEGRRVGYKAVQGKLKSAVKELNDLGKRYDALLTEWESAED